MRTEKEILKDFEKLGYEIQENSVNKIYMRKKNGTVLSIIKFESDTWKKGYRKYDVKEDFLALIVTMEEHKLLTDLFKIWRWL